MSAVFSESKSAEGFVGYLISEKILPENSGKRLLAAYKATGHSFDTIVIELGLMREELLARLLSQYFEIALVEHPGAQVDSVLAQKIGLAFFKTNTIIPHKSTKAGEPVYVLADPFDDKALRMLAYFGAQSLVPAVSTRSAISNAIASLELEMTTPNEALMERKDDVSESDLDRLRDFAEQAPIVRLVTRLAQTASDAHATDIHIEPFEHELRIRIRVDGVLKALETVPKSYLPGISTRLKILANLDISERRLPQDGRIRIAVRGQEIDMRISLVPSIHGETIAMRLLDRSSVALDLAALGFEQNAQELLENITQMPNGIILITGPTGSGKTTTLYALISILNDSGVKIFTVEDPVEYQLNGITQLQTNSATGMTFARALRSVLRQDPDIILVGEIRDVETAEIAMQAALTGHLVLSTLHTNSAVGAITRLRDMGIEDYLIGATVKGIVGQRLVRKSCRCRENSLNLVCPECEGSGFSGRTVTYEIVNISETVSSLISRSADEDTILKCLRADGMKTIEEHAEGLVKTGMTTAAEVARTVRFNERAQI